MVPIESKVGAEAISGSIRLRGTCVAFLSNILAVVPGRSGSVQFEFGGSMWFATRRMSSDIE